MHDGGGASEAALNNVFRLMDVCGVSPHANPRRGVSNLETSVSNIEAHLYTEAVAVGGRYNYKTISSLHLHFHLKPKNLPVIRLSPRNTCMENSSDGSEE